MSKNILIIDDSTEMQELYKIFFNQLGCTVTTVNDGNKALERIEGENFDLIISDVNHPGIKEMEFLRKIKQNPKTTSTPIFLITGWYNDEDSQEARNIGITEYLPKPLRIETLTKVVEKNLGIKVTKT